MRALSAVLLAGALVGCSDSGSSTAGTGGVPSNGGASTGTGGAPASGATAGAGGTSSTGGAAPNGGSTSTAGATASGGSAPAGGATANGGSTPGTGGASATGGNTSSTGGASAAGGGTSSGGSSNTDSGTWWKPAPDTTFFWDLQSTPPDNTTNVGAYDIDGWGNDAAEVSALHARGVKVVCYMDAGTYEPGRPDSNDFSAGLEGAAVQGWPGEIWLDVRPSGPNYQTLQNIMQNRFEVCRQKGFDAVEPDNIDSYQNQPGFSTTGADQLAYNEWLAATAHGLGLAILQKNDLDQVRTLEPYFDGILDEECNRYSECDTLAPYTAAGKPAWNAEYTEDGETTAKFCTADQNAGIVGALFGLDLDGTVFEPCANDVGIRN